MTSLKKSEFKAMVKSIVRECIREIIDEQIDPGPIKETLFKTRHRVVATDNVLVQQKPEIHEQLQRQSQRISQQTLGPSNISDMAGHYFTENSGYTSPSDRLKAAQNQPVRALPARTQVVVQEKQPSILDLAFEGTVPLQHDKQEATQDASTNLKWASLGFK